MVYLKIGNEYADGCFNHLEIFLKMIDNELSQIYKNIQRSPDPDSEGLCDLGEYLTGYGFVAIQRYISSTYPQTGKNKGEIYKLGFKLSNELFLIQSIHAGANYWKHHEEWYSTEEKTEKQKKKTDADISRVLSSIEKITPYADYTLSNLLAGILENISPKLEYSFSPLLPYIEQWRNTLDTLPVINKDH